MSAMTDTKAPQAEGQSVMEGVASTSSVLTDQMKAQLLHPHLHKIKSLAELLSWYVSGGYNLGLVVGTLAAAPLFPDRAVATPVWYYRVPNGVVTYDNRGSIANVTVGAASIGGEALRIMHGYIKHGAYAVWRGKEAGLVILPWEIREADGRHYFNTSAGTYRYELLEKKEYIDFTDKVLKFLATTTGSSPTISTMSTVKGVIEKLNMFLSDPYDVDSREMKTLGKCVSNLKDKGKLGDVEVELRGHGLKLLSALEALAVSKMEMSELSAYLRDVKKVGRAVTLFACLGRSLPQTVGSNGPLVSCITDNPIKVATLDMVGPNQYVLLAKQKATEKAIRDFIEKPDPMVMFCSTPTCAIAANQSSGKKQKGNAGQKTRKSISIPTTQACLFQALRSGIVAVGAPRSSASSSQPGAPGNYTF